MSKKQWIIELAMPAAFILMAAFVAVQSLSMGSEGIFPMMSAGVLFLCAVYLLFQTLKKQQAVVNLQGVNLKMVGVTLLALLVYVFLLKKIGYVIDTFLLCAFIIRSLGYRKYGMIAVCSVAAVAAVFVIFKVVLSVPLPMIILDF